jgi:uncharacterized protein (TIGR02246 family)
MNAVQVEEIKRILSRQQEAWNRADASGFSQDCDMSISFTNILGKVYFGRNLFDERHTDILSTIFKGSALSLSIRRIHFPSPDVAIADLSAAVSDYQALPPEVKSPADGVLRTSLLQVFIRAESGWRVVAYHNVDIKNSRMENK